MNHGPRHANVPSGTEFPKQSPSWGHCGVVVSVRTCVRTVPGVLVAHQLPMWRHTPPRSAPRAFRASRPRVSPAVRRVFVRRLPLAACAQPRMIATTSFKPRNTLRTLPSARVPRPGAQEIKTLPETPHVAIRDPARPKT